MVGSIEFDFREEYSRLLGKIMRPVARAALINGSQKAYYFFYVDSGADFTLVPKSVGEFLGFKIEDSSEIVEAKGISDKALPIVPKKARISFGGEYEFDIRLLWALSEEVPILLGRTDLFDYFDVIFEKNRKTIFTK